MIVRSTLGAALVAAAFSLASPSAASAASVMTDAFLTHANQDIDFLDRSSRFALQNSRSPKLKAFAYDQARDQTLTGNAIGDWIKADLGGDQVITGRSVALDNVSPVTRTFVTMNTPTGQEDLDNLEGLTGKDFDDIYRARQKVTLEQLKVLYTAYAASGDDKTLVSIASRELPKINHRLAELGRL